MVKQMLFQQNVQLWEYDKEQWGYGEGSFTFPISFTEACYSVSLTRSTGNHEHSLILTSKNLTNITWKSKGTNQSNGETSGYVFVVGI